MRAMPTPSSAGYAAASSRNAPSTMEAFGSGSSTRIRSNGVGRSKDHLPTNASGPRKNERPTRIWRFFRRFTSVGQNFRA
jgi:hypothetical protein